MHVSGVDDKTELAASGDRELLLGDGAIDRFSYSAAGRSVRLAMEPCRSLGSGASGMDSGIDTVTGEEGTGTAVGAGDELAAKTSNGFSGLGRAVSFACPSSVGRPRKAGSVSGCMRFCGGGKRLKLPGGLLARSFRSERS